MTKGWVCGLANTWNQEARVGSNQMRVEMGYLAKGKMRCCYQEKEEWVLGRQKQPMSIHHQYFQCLHVLTRRASLVCCPPARAPPACVCCHSLLRPLQAQEAVGPTLPPSYWKLKLVTPWAPFRGISETSCARTCHLLVSESFLSKELSSSLLSQVAGCHLKRQLKSLTKTGLKSALTGLVSESLTPQQKLSLIMFRYVRGGIRLEERMHEIGV